MRHSREVPVHGRHAGRYDPRSGWGYRFFRFTLCLLLAAVLLWPVLEPFFLEVEYTYLTSVDLPGSIGQLRIVYLTDIHKGGLYTAGRLQGLIDRINALDADLVLLGGDYASDSDSAIRFFEEMPPIRSRHGVYGVLGNHDRTLPESNLEKLQAAMRRAGVTPLVNAVEPVRISNGYVYLAGIDDVHNGHPQLAQVARQVRARDYVIFLSHSPAVIDEAIQKRDASGDTQWFDLGLFGHTHGGQAALFGDLFPQEGVPAVYRQGWLTRNRAAVLISRGVGTSGLPLRWLCRPQIHVITVSVPQ